MPAGQRHIAATGRTAPGVTTWPGVSFDEQYDALAHGTGAFPCGGMYYCGLRGPDAVRVLDALTPRRVSALGVGHGAFAIFTTPDGTVDTEGVIVRDGEESFRISIGGDTRPPNWLHDAVYRFPRVTVAEPDLSSFNLKGPGRDRAMLELISAESVPRVLGLAPFRGTRVTTRWGAEAWVLRTVIGVEMWGTADVMHEAWQRMVAMPDTFTPCGWHVLATYRLECDGFPFYLCPLDVHRGTYLRDAGLGHLVSRRKPEPFVGREALWDPDRFSGRKWVGGLVAMSPDSPRRQIGEPVSSERDAPVGYVTSAGYSPQAGRELCFAHLPDEVRPGDVICCADGSTWQSVPLPLPRHVPVAQPG